MRHARDVLSPASLVSLLTGLASAGPPFRFFATLSILGIFLLLSVSRAAADPFTLSTVDATNSMGHWTSLAIDFHGNPHISYEDVTNGHLRYAKWNGSSWDKEIVDPDNQTGAYSSIALDAAGNPHISYYDGFNNRLRYAHKDTLWHIDVPDQIPTAGIGHFTSIALDATGKPRISYEDYINGHLKFASWNGSSWTIEFADPSNVVGSYTSLALDASGNPHISYYDGFNNRLRYAHRDTLGWHVDVPDQIASAGIGHWTSIALDATGKPRISYEDYINGHLKFASWNGSSWDIAFADPSDGVGQYTSLDLDYYGNPRISYYDVVNHHLRYAWRTGASWQSTLVDPGELTGAYTSLKKDCAGNPRISYYDGTFDDLKFATMGSHVCPAPNPVTSTVPTFVRVVGTRSGIPDPSGTFTATIRDATGAPFAGAVVGIDFSRCSDTVLNLAQATDVTLSCANNTVTKITNVAGQATFTIVGAGNVAPCTTPPTCPPGAGLGCVHVCADGIALGTATAIIYDLDGAIAAAVGDKRHTDGINSSDYAIVSADVACASSGGSYRGRSDFSADGTISSLDIAAYLNQVLRPAMQGQGSADGSGRAVFCTTPFAPYCP